MTDKGIAFSGYREENAFITSEIIRDVLRVLSEDDLVNGRDVVRLEASLQEACGRQHAVAVASGTDAIFFALAANGIGPGDEVLVPGFTFVATASAILRTGARPVFVDVSIDAEERGIAPCTMDLDDAEARLSSRTRAIVWVGMYGGLSDPEAIAAFASRHDLVLIEDAAQSFGASYDSIPAGRLGAASALSFDRQKTLSALGTAGAVVTDDATVAARIRALRYHGKAGGGYAQLGFNSQLNSISAAVLLTKKCLFEQWAERRRSIAAQYDAAFAGTSVHVLFWPKRSKHARHKYVLLVRNRPAFQKFLAANDVPTKVHYERPLYREQVFADGREAVPLLRTCDHLSDMVVSLPIHAFLTDPQVNRIIETVRCYDAAAPDV